MKNIKYLLLIIFISFIGCEDEGDPVLYEALPSQTGQQPVITAMSPASAFAGDEIVTITGQNFLHGTDTTKVYFGSARAKIFSISNEKIEVYAPVVPKQASDIQTLSYNDTNVVVRISVPYTTLFNDEYKYNLINGITKFGNIDQNSLLSPRGIAVDKDGNIIVSYLEGVDESSVGLKRIASDGTFFSTFSSNHRSGYYPSMKFGPGDTIYTASSDPYEGIAFYPKEGGRAANLKIRNKNTFKITDFDFDANKYLWVGGNGSAGTIDSIIRVVISPFSTKSYGFQGAIRCMRVFSGALYVAAKVNNEEIIYKANIGANNDLSAREEYYNLGTIVPNSMTFDADGNLYIASEDINGLLEIKSDKSVTYRYDNYLPFPLTSIQWGPDNYLYGCIQTNAKKGSVVKIDMRTNGAPYYGRQ